MNFVVPALDAQLHRIGRADHAAQSVAVLDEPPTHSAPGHFCSRSLEWECSCRSELKRRNFAA
jgi:hypothetical protein